MPTGPADRLWRRPCLEVSEDQLPDLWEPNSVSELEPAFTSAGSTPASRQY